MIAQANVTTLKISHHAFFQPWCLMQIKEIQAKLKHNVIHYVLDRKKQIQNENPFFKKLKWYIEKTFSDFPALSKLILL